MPTVNYQLQDLVPFSSEVFWATLQGYTDAIWPLQAVWLVLSLLIVLSLTKNKLPAFCLVATGLAWTFIACVYQYRYFATIIWIAPYIAVAFAVQGIVLLTCAWAWRHRIARSPAKPFFYGGIALFIAAAFVPHTEPSLLFGWGPDQTGLGTLGLLAAQDKPRRAWPLYFVPIFWLLLSLLLQLGMR